MQLDAAKVSFQGTLKRELATSCPMHGSINQEGRKEPQGHEAFFEYPGYLRVLWVLCELRE
jgi:hypothetical protein